MVKSVRFYLNLRALSTNQLHKTTKRGIVYCDPKFTAFKDKVIELLALAPEYELINYPIALHIQFRFRGKRKIDLDNCLKSLFDSFNQVVWVDDSLVESLTAVKLMNYEQDSIEIVILDLSNNVFELTD